MASGSAHVTLLKSKRLVEDFKEERGFKTFSEALRYVVEDYFRLRRQLDEARDADFNRVCELIAGKGGSDFNRAVIEDLDALKGTMNEVKNMLLVVGSADDKLKAALAEYFPQYFVERS
jgi:spore coat polysaccharide biosynthesis predicted glycosyltransferase SpsG